MTEYKDFCEFCSAHKNLYYCCHPDKTSIDIHLCGQCIKDDNNNICIKCSNLLASCKCICSNNECNKTRLECKCKDCQCRKINVTLK
jgi:hypothetical protein